MGNYLSEELSYDKAVSITDQAEATEYLAKLAAKAMKDDPALNIAQALVIQRTNIGYWAGYGDIADRMRVYKLYGAVHPIFGMDFDPLPGEAFDAGYEAGKKLADVKSRP